MSIRRFHCNECDVSFKGEGLLMRHLRTVHKGVIEAEIQERLNMAIKNDPGHTKKLSR